MMELTACAFILTLISLVTATPYGYGVKGGAGASGSGKCFLILCIQIDIQTIIVRSILIVQYCNKATIFSMGFVSVNVIYKRKLPIGVFKMSDHL